jgi:CRP/FNR family cyclic AMP-dependent transcriptional regulator
VSSPESLPHETVVALLDGVDFLASLAPEEVDALARRARTVAWEPGTVVFEEGDRGEECYVVRSGRAKVMRRLADGQRITLAQVTRGGVVGELALFAGDRRSASMEVVEPTTAVAIAGEDLVEILHRDAAAAVGMAVHVTDLLRTANDRLFNTATSTVSGRLVATLLAQVEARQARDPGEHDVELVGSTTDLARLAGAPRDDAARVLHLLENEGVITIRRGRIIVHSPAALRGHLG